MAWGSEGEMVLVQLMRNGVSDSAILEGIIGLVKMFQRDMIAEGVQTNAHGLNLIKPECVLCQGYGVVHPIQAKEFVQWPKSLQFFDD